MTKRPALAAAALFLASVVLFWPGYAMYDTVAQYEQVVTGVYDDWHPPAMARLWSVFAGAGWRGAAPMLVMQLGFYWLGLGLIAAAVRGRSGFAILATGMLPVFLGWQGVVLKDAQMTGALLGATGLIGWWRLRARPVPALAAAGAAALVAYAVLVRANAVFAAMPLAVLLAGRPRRWPARAAVIAIGTVAILALLSSVNHLLLGASPSGVERTQALYDLAGIAVRAPAGADHVGMTPAAAAQLAARRCVRPFFWDPLGEPARCNATVEPLRHVAVGTLYVTLVDAIVHHPMAYAAHRLAHLNSTERWLVPRRWPGAAPPTGSEPNNLGLGTPPLAKWWQAIAGWLVETPLGWPFVWVLAAAVMLATAVARRPTPARDLALALLTSALALEASFALLSIASDLRYHLWPMIATAVATALLLGEGPPPRRVMVAGGGVLAVTILAGLVARWSLPLPPQSYIGMLG